MKFTYSAGDRPLDGYTIQHGIGRGGFGEVYQAVSDGGKIVALKLIQRHLNVELRGVGQCLNLKHAHLVALYDVKRGANEDHWVVMEFVAGESLDQVIAYHPQGMPVDDAVEWLRGICEGVGYLHGRSIVHRDLKPGNIFREEGTVKIGDYGLSKFISASRRSGQTESIGTVHYMAPEIARGKYGGEIDLYALGVIFYEMLTGRVPFDGESPGEILMKHLSAEPDLAPLPPRYREVVGILLEKEPERRYSSTQVLLAEVKKAEAGGPITDSWQRTPRPTDWPAPGFAEHEPHPSPRSADNTVKVPVKKPDSFLDGQAKHRPSLAIGLLISLLAAGGMGLLVGVISFARTDLAPGAHFFFGISSGLLTLFIIVNVLYRPAYSPLLRRLASALLVGGSVGIAGASIAARIFGGREPVGLRGPVLSAFIGLSAGFLTAGSMAYLLLRSFTDRYWWRWIVALLMGAGSFWVGAWLAMGVGLADKEEGTIIPLAGFAVGLLVCGVTAYRLMLLRPAEKPVRPRSPPPIASPAVAPVLHGAPTATWTPPGARTTRPSGLGPRRGVALQFTFVLFTIVELSYFILALNRREEWTDVAAGWWWGSLQFEVHWIWIWLLVGFLYTAITAVTWTILWISVPPAQEGMPLLEWLGETIRARPIVWTVCVFLTLELISLAPFVLGLVRWDNNTVTFPWGRSWGQYWTFWVLLNINQVLGAVFCGWAYWWRRHRQP